MNRNNVLASVLSVAVAFLLCFVAIALTRGSVVIALEAYAQMLYGGLGDFPRFFETGNWALLTRPWGESATKAALLIFTGLSVAVAFRAGLFNIGAQGQMIWGALIAALVGAHVSAPALLHPLLAILGAAAAGAIYALFAAVLKLRRGVHEVISTIMLNWIAVSLVEGWLVVGPLRAGAQEGLSRSGTEEILATAQLPRLLGDLSRLNLGFFLALLVVGVTWLWFTRMRGGFETRVVGLSPRTAEASGIRTEARTYQAMALAGAFAGTAGALLVLGTENRFPVPFGAPYGFDGIAISLIGQNHPLGVCAAALLFGVLRAGGTRMQLLGVHKSFPELIQGLALLFVAGAVVWEWALARRRRRRMTQLASAGAPRA